MPRQSRKAASQKSPLLFLEPSLGGARLKNVPEVRAAFNPRSFITEKQSDNNAALTSWVSPQFDQSHLAAPPLRRGRQKYQSTTSILDGSNQLSRKSKFPSLSFEQRTRDQSHQPKTTRRKKATETSLVPGPGCQRQGSRQVNKTFSHQNAQVIDTPKRQSSSLRKRNVWGSGLCNGAASPSRCLEQLEAQSTCMVGRPQIPAPSGSIPPSRESHTPNVSVVFTPPNVDTPDILPEGGSCCPSSPFLHLLLPLSQPSTPPHHRPADILVADTPERDYGVKVTWQRRRGLMMLLKEKGLLSDSAALISS